MNHNYIKFLMLLVICAVELQGSTGFFRGHRPSPKYYSVAVAPLPKGPGGAAETFKKIDLSATMASSASVAAPTKSQKTFSPAAAAGGSEAVLGGFKQWKVLKQNSAMPWEGLEPNLIQGVPGLAWKNVRQEDGTNCAYHALKNLTILVPALQSHCDTEFIDIEIQALAKRLNDQKYLFENLNKWVPKIYASRKKLVLEFLRKEEDMSDEQMLKARSGIRDSSILSYLNSVDGHIKTEMLATDEAFNLIQAAAGTISSDVIIMTDQYARSFSEIGIGTKSMDDFLPFLELPDQRSFQHSFARLTAFNEAIDDTVGIMWTYPGFGHWVAYVLQKCNRVITVYYMNSGADRSVSSDGELEHSGTDPEPEITKHLFDFVGFRR